MATIRYHTSNFLSIIDNQLSKSFIDYKGPNAFTGKAKKTVIKRWKSTCKKIYIFFNRVYCPSQSLILKKERIGRE